MKVLINLVSIILYVACFLLAGVFGFALIMAGRLS